jgi:hypothetical protein
MTADEIASIWEYLTHEEQQEAIKLIDSLPSWLPLPGPQRMAYESKADITGYGGAAGGGKSALGVGLALTKHRNSIIFRQNGTELPGVIDELERNIGSRDGYNGQDKIWKHVDKQGKKRKIELGAFPNPGDEKKYQGRPHDLCIFDEAANMRESAVRFLMGWVRTVNPHQPCRVLMTFNPPTSAEGRWIIDFYAPWLDPKHPNPASSGELRWYAVLDGKETEVATGRPIERNGEIITPKSRTFIASRISDNPYLMGTNYMSTLQALPEPLRSQMLNGDFMAGVEDDAMQVIPTAWIEAAQARWIDHLIKPEMDSIGIDVARGGKDNTVIARRHGQWYDRPLLYPGKETPDGPSVAGYAIAAARDRAVMHIDVIGVGASPYDFLIEAKQQVIGVNVSEAATGTDRSGRLRFKNQRSQLFWQFRELLDPSNNSGICLPPDKQLLSDLTAFTWKLSGSTIQVCSREEVVEKIGRSPDYASAYVLAQIETPKRDKVFNSSQQRQNKVLEYDPYQAMQR